jgi:hypothetical protein
MCTSAVSSKIRTCAIPPCDKARVIAARINSARTGQRLSALRVVRCASYTKTDARCAAAVHSYRLVVQHCARSGGASPAHR